MRQTIALSSTGVDSVALARLLPTRGCLLFERFDPATRRRSRSMLALQWQVLAGATFEETLRNVLSSGEAAGDADDVHLAFCGHDEAATGQDGEGWPPFFVFRLTEYIDIDHGERTATHVCTASSNLVLTDALPGLLDRAVAQPGRSGEGPVADGAGWSVDVDVAGHTRRVRSLQRDIAAGALEGAVLSVGLSKRTAARPLDIYAEMVAINPSTFGYCLELDGHALIGSSPLAFMDVENGVVRLETDAGTRPVTGNEAADAAARQELLSSAKDASEHAVVVAEELEALRGLADSAGVHKVVDREVRAFSHVMHLYTVLTARLRSGVDLAAALLHMFPPAAVSGRPRKAARDAGLALEGGSRGPYGGVLGLVRGRDALEFAVVIRSLWIEAGIAKTRVGGKIVAHSDGADEYDEALNKSRFIVQSVSLAQAGAGR